MCGYAGMWGWGGWVVMTVAMVVLFAVVIAAVVVAVRSVGGGTRPVAPLGRTPQDVLADRFARGEVDDEEYHRRMALLRDHQ